MGNVYAGRGDGGVGRPALYGDRVSSIESPPPVDQDNLENESVPVRRDACRHIWPDDHDSMVTDSLTAGMPAWKNRCPVRGIPSGTDRRNRSADKEGVTCRSSVMIPEGDRGRMSETGRSFKVRKLREGGAFFQCGSFLKMYGEQGRERGKRSRAHSPSPLGHAPICE